MPRAGIVDGTSLLTTGLEVGTGQSRMLTTGMESGQASLGHGTETRLPPLAIFAQMANQVPAIGGKCLTMFDSISLSQIST